MSPAASERAAAGGPETVEEIRWLVVWPNGDVYSSHTTKQEALNSFDALVAVLRSYGVPNDYHPTVKRRRRTVSKSAWEDA